MNKIMIKYVLLILLCLFICSCGETVTSESFIPAKADGIINLDIQEILDSEFLTILTDSIIKEAYVNPLELINITLQNYFGTNLKYLYRVSVFFIIEENSADYISSGLIFEFKELDHDLIYEFLNSMLKLSEYKNFIYYYSDILDSCVALYKNFIFYSSSRELIENMLDTTEEKISKNNKLYEILEPIKEFPVKGALIVTKNNFKNINDSILKLFNKENQETPEYSNLQTDLISFIFSAEFIKTLYLNLIISFTEISDAQAYHNFLNTLLTSVQAAIEDDSEYGSLFLELFNNLDLYTQNDSISISINIPHTFISNLIAK